jgi:hypothetical protein
MESTNAEIVCAGPPVFGVVISSDRLAMPASAIAPYCPPSSIAQKSTADVVIEPKLRGP